MQTTPLQEQNKPLQLFIEKLISQLFCTALSLLDYIFISKRKGNAHMKKIMVSFSFLALMTVFSLPGYTFYRDVTKQRSDPIPRPTIPLENESEEAVEQPQEGMVMSPDGEIIGVVIDYIFDLQSSRVFSMVVVMPLSTEQAPPPVMVLPWSLVRVGPEGNSFTLKEDLTYFQNLFQSSLHALPYSFPVQWQAVSHDARRNQNDEEMLSGLSPEVFLVKASDLIGKMLTTKAGEQVGEIAEILVDPQRGSILSAIIAAEEKSNPEEVLFYSLPWARIHVNPLKMTLILSQV